MKIQNQDNKTTVRNLAIFIVLILASGWIGRGLDILAKPGMFSMESYCCFSTWYDSGTIIILFGKWQKANQLASGFKAINQNYKPFDRRVVCSDAGEMILRARGKELLKWRALPSTKTLNIACVPDRCSRVLPTAAIAHG